MSINPIRVTMWTALAVGSVTLLLGGCKQQPERKGEAAKPKQGGPAMTITVTSSAFGPNQPIPKKYTGEGVDVSPPLEFAGIPAEAKELALICDDPDAPRAEPWVHWVIYKIPPNTTALPEGVERTERPANVPGALQGRNDWGTIGYRGPMPPPGHGVHHYHFKVYALDAPLDVGPGLSKAQLLKAMEGHIIAQGELIGTYER